MNHFNISILKSILRIIAGIYLMFGFIFVTGALIVVAELLGILEEFVDKRKDLV